MALSKIGTDIDFNSNNSQLISSVSRADEGNLVLISCGGIDTVSADIVPTDLNFSSISGGITGTHIYSAAGTLASGYYGRIHYYAFPPQTGGNTLYLQMAGTCELIYWFARILRGCGAHVESESEVDSGSLDVGPFDNVPGDGLFCDFVSATSAIVNDDFDSFVGTDVAEYAKFAAAENIPATRWGSATSSALTLEAGVRFEGLGLGLFPWMGI